MLEPTERPLPERLAEGEAHINVTAETLKKNTHALLIKNAFLWRIYVQNAATWTVALLVTGTAALRLNKMKTPAEPLESPAMRLHGDKPSTTYPLDCREHWLHGATNVNGTSACRQRTCVQCTRCGRCSLHRQRACSKCCSASVLASTSKRASKQASIPEVLSLQTPCGNCRGGQDSSTEILFGAFALRQTRHDTAIGQHGARASSSRSTVEGSRRTQATHMRSIDRAWSSALNLLAALLRATGQIGVLRGRIFVFSGKRPFLKWRNALLVRFCSRHVRGAS